MAKVPVITSPCPLRWQQTPQPGKDFCGLCQRRVHNLDGMSESERATFLAECNTADVCVAYTVKRAPRVAMMAVTLAAVAGVAQADDIASVPTNKPEPGTYCPLSEHRGDYEVIEIVLGSTLTGKAQQWVGADEAAAPDRPDLPVIDGAEWLPTPEETDEG